MLLSVITPSFNGEHFIKDYLNSLDKNLPPESEIIIVDNGSVDQTRNIIKQFPKVHLVENSTNRGFSRANNQGAKIARGEYLLFINQDITVPKNAVEKLLDYAQNHPEAGIIGPKLINPGGQIQKSATNLPTLWRAIKEFILGQKNSYSQYTPKGEGALEVEALYGAVVLIKKDLFEEVGGWDERYFIYYEDLELCRQVRKRGFKIIYLADVEFKHLLGASSKEVEPMPFGIRTLSWFWPVKKSGSRYFLVQGARIYHGSLVATLIGILMFLKTKIKRSV